MTTSEKDLPKPKATHPVLLFIIAGLAAAVIGLVLWIKLFPSEVSEGAAADYLAFTGFSNSVHKLSPAFKDEDRDLVADAPTDPVHWIDPPTLVFCFVATDDAEDNKAQWQPFSDYLSKATGKPVEYLLVTSTQDELEAMHDGKLQVAGFNTGAVPPAVNLTGFVPVLRTAHRRWRSTHSHGHHRAGRQSIAEARRPERPRIDADKSSVEQWL